MSVYICNICGLGFQTMDQEFYHYTTPEHKAKLEELEAEELDIESVYDCKEEGLK